MSLSCLEAPARAGLGLALALTLLGAGPCGPVAGCQLSGNVVQGAVEDWSFANEVRYCAVEVRPESPHSVTVNCMAVQGELFISCSECAVKSWSSYALENPAARIRIGDDVYPVTLERVEGEEVLERVWAARSAKVGEREGRSRPEGWWAFRLTSR